jgi:hypothetical protein
MRSPYAESLAPSSQRGQWQVYYKPLGIWLPVLGPRPRREAEALVVTLKAEGKMLPHCVPL